MRAAPPLDRPAILPHPSAPLFSAPDAALVLDQVIAEISTGRFPTTEALRSVFRQAGFVNLFFFLKFIAGYRGPYSKLRSDIHMEMCNFRQLALIPGSKIATFVPRSTYKSTVNTHGGSAWEMLRNPDIRIGIFSSVYDRAHDFFAQTQRIFDSNEFVTWLYPEYIPSGADGSRWNDKEGVLPNRTMSFPEPNIRPFASGGSTQGIHVDRAIFDDIVGDAQLTAGHTSGLEMERIGDWFQASQRTILISMLESSVVLSATRYAVDDPYEDVMLDAREQYGFWDEIQHRYPVNERGEWKVYYRMAIERGESIFPEQYTPESLAKLAAKDAWTYFTQYLNNPVATSSIEFANYPVHGCTLDFDDEQGWTIIIDATDEKIPLRLCDVVLSCDPASSETRTSSRTSQTAVVVLARSKDGRKFVLIARKGYVETTTWFDWLFALKRMFHDNHRATFIEMQSNFKALESIIRAEETNRQDWLNYIPVPALGDKVVTIRNIIQPELERGNLYVNEEYRHILNEELMTFPASTKKDLLDALKIAIKFSTEPTADDDSRYYTRTRVSGYLDDANPVTGY